MGETVDRDVARAAIRTASAHQRIGWVDPRTRRQAVPGPDLHLHQRQDRAARGHWRPGSPSRARYRRALAQSRGEAEPTEEHRMNETQPVRILGLHGVRYQVTDVARAAAFYTDHLGFRLEHQQLPAFASVLLGDFSLLLSGPGASGSRPLPAANPSSRADGIDWSCACQICT